MNYLWEITLTIEGKGNLNIITADISSDHGYHDNLPEEIYVNGLLQAQTGKIAYNLNLTQNIIKLKWNSPLTNCKNMFRDLSNIIKIDLSNFDSSRVTNMFCMFIDCHSLTSIDFTNFNTSIVTNTRSMFNGCYSLKSLELSSFNTSVVKTMEYMFLDCHSLKYLDLTSFDISSVTTMEDMFQNCQSLKFINLYSFIEKNLLIVSGMFNYIPENLTYCINENKAPKISSVLQAKGFNKNCSFCSNNKTHKYQYKFECFLTGPERTFVTIENKFLCKECENYYNYNQTSCLDEIPEGYFLNNSLLKAIDKCH